MKRILIIGVLFLTATLFFAEVLFGPRVFLDANPYHFDPWRHYALEGDLDYETHRTDALFTYFPRRFELSQAVRSGRCPLWNPHILCGMPFFADPQTRVLYPIALLLVLVDPVKAMGVDLAIHLFIAMLGMYLFLRSIRVSTLGSILGALTYPFSSFFYVRLGHPTFVATASWVPWFFFAFEEARRHERRGTLLLTLFLVMGYLAGFPQVFLFGVGAVVVYGLYLSLDSQHGTRLRSTLKTAKILSVSGLLAVLLISIQLVPFVELSKNSTGLLVDFTRMKEVFLTPPILLMRSFFPGLFGNPVEGTDWSALTREFTHTYNPDFAVYCGMGALLAALGGVAFIRREKRVRAFLILIGLTVSMATFPPVIRLGYILLPTLRVSRISRIAVMGCFALSALAGLSLSLISENLKQRDRRRVLVLVVLGAATVLVVGSVLLSSVDSFLSGYIEAARSYSEEIEQSTHVTARSVKVRDWAETSSVEWPAYERRQIARGMVFAALSGTLLLLCVWWGGIRKPVRVGIGIIFVLVTVVDVGLVAKTYFVSQVSHDLFRTKGIAFLQEVLGDEARWRILTMKSTRQTAEAFPPNTNQIFGIPSMMGASTILPQSHTDLTDAVGTAEMPAHLLDRETPMGWVQILTSNLASARYCVAGTRRTPLPVSPVLRVVAARTGQEAPLELLTLGGDTRLALLQKPGKRMNFAMDLPAVRALDFAVGFNSEAKAPGDTLVFLCAWRLGSQELRFRVPLDLYKDKDMWHPLRVDISSHSGGHVRFKMDIATEGSRHSVSAGWSGFDLVQGDCKSTSIPGGYQLTDADDAEFVSLTLRSDCPEIPLEVISSEDRISRRWISFPPDMPVRQMTIDLRERNNDRIAIRSDSAFILLAARVILMDDAYPDYQLIWDKDMYIYENHAAVERGVCVNRSAVKDTTEEGERILRVAHLDDIGNIKCGSCRITAYEPERILLEVSAERECFLLFQDSYYPGWKASVDGVETDIIRTDIGMRALAVSPGNHSIEMRFKPGSLRLGLLLTLLGVILTCAYAKARDRVVS